MYLMGLMSLYYPVNINVLVGGNLVSIVFIQENIYFLIVG